MSLRIIVSEDKNCQHLELDMGRGEHEHACYHCSQMGESMTCKWMREYVCS